MYKVHKLPKCGLCLKEMSGGSVCWKKGSSIYFWSETREINMAGKKQLWIIKLKLNCSRYRPGVAQRVGRVIALLFHDRDTRRGWVVSSTTRPHFTSGPVWTGGKSRPHRVSIPVRPSRSLVAIPTELPGPTNYDLYGTFILTRHCQLHQRHILTWAGHLMRVDNDRRLNKYSAPNRITGWIKKSWKTEIAMGRWSWSRYENIRGEGFEEVRPRRRRMSKASKEGRDPPRAVEPMMMMMMMMTTTTMTIQCSNPVRTKRLLLYNTVHSSSGSNPAFYLIYSGVLPLK